MNNITIIPIKNLPEFSPKHDLADELIKGFENNNIALEDNDVIVVTQKIVSKAENRLIENNFENIEELIKAGLYNQVSQAFCAFLPIKSVGVVGDERRYADVIAIRAVETVDFMTATWARLPYDFLAHVSNRIVNELDGVSRVVYDISSKPPATIEWE